MAALLVTAIVAEIPWRRPHRFHFPSGTQGGKGERSNLYGGPLSVSELMVCVYLLCLFVLTTQSIISERLTFFMLFSTIREIFVFC